MAVLQRLVDKIKQIYLVYELRTAISMLEPWEKRLFNSVLLLFIAIQSSLPAATPNSSAPVSTSSVASKQKIGRKQEWESRIALRGGQELYKPSFFIRSGICRLVITGDVAPAGAKALQKIVNLSTSSECSLTEIFQCLMDLANQYPTHSQIILRAFGLAKDKMRSSSNRFDMTYHLFEAYTNVLSQSELLTA
ncbi:hypothetical protein CDAR_534051 [Caerostris darwini]|uniref:Uncharacterized protein n=1 Tax=Caerostris darwini TaxID=1538125 RepID=A0AAV4S4P6_9ARAC|nr:hypothetical protein CDAR_534051 [Caerostris darwini]